MKQVSLVENRRVEGMLVVGINAAPEQDESLGLTTIERFIAQQALVGAADSKD